MSKKSNNIDDQNNSKSLLIIGALQTNKIKHDTNKTFDHDNDYESANIDVSVTSDEIFKLGTYYQDGIGVEKDEYKAFNYFNRSAMKGHVEGTFNVGYCYRNGIGVDKN
ncbi:hypothetical protein C2G38_2052203, partial [Gigaspora rosea]